MHRASLLLVAALGCNEVYDLRATDVDETEPGDVDADGIVDPDDNCPAIANADQADFDVDGFGDACDACPTGDATETVDEDGDGVVDVCDNCPGLENRAQSDGDGDGIGDSCDLLATTQRRVLFDGFSPPHASWTTPWSETSGALRPSTVPSEMTLPGVRLVGSEHREWHVEAQIDLELMSAQDGTFALRMTNPTTGVSFECGILVTNGRTTGYNGRPGLPVDQGDFRFVVPRTTLRASLGRPNPTGRAGIECSWDSVAYTFESSASQSDMLEVELSLVATVPHAIRYVDLVE